MYTRGHYYKQPDRSVDNLVSRVRKKLKLLSMSDYQIKSSSSLGYVMLGDEQNFFSVLSKNIEQYEQNINKDI